MAAVKKIDVVSDELLTTTNSSFQSLAEAAISDNCSFLLEGWVVGRLTSTGQTGTSVFIQRGKRVSGTVSFIGSIVSVVSFFTGSEIPFTSIGSNPAVRFITSDNNNIILQVRPGLAGAIETEWYGGFTMKMN